MAGPPHELLDAPDQRLDLRGDEERRGGIVQRDVDPAAGGPPDRGLRERLPARVEEAEQRVEDRCLEPVADRRPGVRVEMPHEVRAERRGNPDVGLAAGMDPAVLDPIDEAVMHAGHGGERAARQPGVLALADDLVGELPGELRLTGGAARSKALRAVLSACVEAPVRVSAREEAGAAGAAMMAAVAVGAYPTMDACIAEWVTPLLGEPEAPNADLVRTYRGLFPAYAETRRALVPVWSQLAREREATSLPVQAEPEHTEQTLLAAISAERSA